MNVIDVFDKGGIIVWVLAGYSFIALTLLFERLIHFTFMRRPQKNLEKNMVEGFKSHTIEPLLNSMRGPEARVLQGIYEAYQAGVKDLNRVASRIGSIELVNMERGFRTLSFLGNTAPLLGLLGTIIGMIKAFMVIEQAGGQVDAQALAGGIWEAMLTTGVGLAVAIPVLLLLHLLEGRADKRAQSMRNYASLMLEYLPQQASGAEVKDTIHHQDGITHAI